MISCLGTPGLASVAPYGPQTSRNRALEVAPKIGASLRCGATSRWVERGFHPTQERIADSTDSYETLHKGLFH